MEMLADQIKKHNINSTPKTHFIKLNYIFSIFIFISLVSFSVSISSFTHHFPNFTDSNDRHSIFLICNGILFILFMNYNSTHDYSIKHNQSAISDEIDHPPVIVSSAKEPVAAIEEQEEKIEEEVNDDEIERNGNRVYVIEDHNAVSIIEDRIEDQMAEDDQHVVVVEEQETWESKEAEETEELNKKCEEFIRNVRERMKSESLCHYGLLQSTF